MDETNTINVEHPRESPFRMHQIGIEGMTCDECVAKVEKALRGKMGVKDVRVDRANAVAAVTYDITQTNIPALHDALLAAGYKPTRTIGAE